jgi:hypothetical protein
MVRMAGGSFVSGNKHPESFTMPARSEPEPEPLDYTQPADMFKRAIRRPAYEEIDFTEIIIKQNDAFDSELEAEAELYSPPSYKEVVDPIFEEQIHVKKEADMAYTSGSEAIPIKMNDTVIGYVAHSDYELEDEPAAEEMTTVIEETVVVEEIETPTEKAVIVEEKITFVEMPAPIEEKTVQMEEVKIEKVHMTEVPAGLHVEGSRPNDVAEMNVSATDVLSSFNEKAIMAEMVATSEAKPMENASQITEEIQVVHEATDVISVIDAAPEMHAENDSETVTGPMILAIADEIEMLKITIPGLCVCDELMSEVTVDCTMFIPDDGLESYDCIFRNAPVTVTETALVAVPAVPESKESAPYTPFKFGF